MELFPLKYRLILCDKNETDGGYSHNRTVKIGTPKEIYYIRDKQYTFEPKGASYRKGRTVFQYKDIVTGETVLSHTSEPTVDPDDIQQRNKEKLAKKATETTGSDFGMVTIIAVGIGALMAGLFIMILAYPSIFPDMMKPATKIVSMVVMH